MSGAAADRNLLLGIIALQMDFISRDSLIAAMHAWVWNKATPLGQILQDKGALTEPRRSLLNALVEEHLRVHDDDPQRSLAALSSIGSVREELSRIADPDLQASLPYVSAARLDQDDDPNRTIPQASLGESTSAGSRFRILRPHAKGGLGQVSVALDQELDRPVALKEIQDHHADEPHSRARFVQEAEITGKLEHPGIIPVYGLGHDAGGRPFYAMRFIQGDSLKQAIAAFHGDEAMKKDAAARGSRLRELLRRFTDVCNAVAYAHSRGVLHRDLKPGNIMLGPYGETLVVDWGLAKSVGDGSSGVSAAGDGSSLTERPIRLSGQSGSRAETVAGSPIGTPAYASPEQVTGALDRLGPASDVYGLGATLYALLTGRSPVESNELVEVIRRVERGEIPPPRLIDPTIPKPLEAICRKAMATSPEDRYVSARAMAKDVTRWLDDDAVVAYREPISVLARRWMRRHRTLVTGAAVAGLAGLIGLGAVATVQTHANRELKDEKDKVTRALGAETRANQMTTRALEAETKAKDDSQAALARSEEARKRAKAVLGFLEDDVLVAARPEGKNGGLGVDVTVRRAVDAAEPKIAERFKDQPIVEAEVRDALGGTYYYLRELTLAIRQWERALELRQRTLGADDLDTLESRNSLAQAYSDVGRVDEAVKMNEATLKLRESKLGPDHPDTLISRNNLASAYGRAGRNDEAIKMQKATLEKRESTLGPYDPGTLFSRNNLAILYQAGGRNNEAIKMLETTLKLFELKFGPSHPDTISVRYNLGDALQKASRTDDAIKMLETALKQRESKLGPDNSDTLTSRDGLASAYRAARRTSEAIKMHEVTLKLRESKLGPDHADTLVSRTNLAEAYGAARRADESIKMYEMTLKLRESKLGPDHADTLVSRSNLASAYSTAGRTDDAIRMYEATLKRMESILGPENPNTLTGRSNLAVAYNRAGRTGDAIRMHEATLKQMESKLGPEHPSTVANRKGLASAYSSAGRIAESVKMYEATLKVQESKFGPDHPETIPIRNDLAATYRDAGRTEDAIKMLEATLKLCERRFGADHRDTLISRANLAKSYQAAGQLDRAVPLLEQVRQTFRAKVGPDHSDTLRSEDLLADAYTAAGRYPALEPLLRAGLERARKRFAPSDARTAEALAQLGSNLIQQRKWAEAETILRECVAICEKAQPDDWTTFNTRSLLGYSLLGQKKFADAEPVILAGYEGMKTREDKISAPGKPNLAAAAMLVLRLYEAWGKPAEATKWKARVGLADLPADVFAAPRAH